MNDKLEINHCTTCGLEIYLEATLYNGLQRLHTLSGGFLCPVRKKPDLSSTKKRTK